MSNMSQYNTKTPPWGRHNNPPLNQPNQLQQQLMTQTGMNNMNAGGMGGMVQFQQQQQQHPQVFQNAGQPQILGLGLQQMATNAMGAAGLGSQLATQNHIFQQVGYPNPRGLNPTAFQTPPQNISAVPPVQGAPTLGTKQRVFTGTVTKVHDNFGFVDEDVFFQTNACVKGSNPMVGDRVLVEASYNPSMPFKWNATRIQVLRGEGLPMSNPSQQQTSRHSSSKYNNSYNAVPPPDNSSNPSNYGNGGGRNGGNNNNNNNNSNNQRPKAVMGRGRERSRDRNDRGGGGDDDETERKRRREERQREREKEEKKSPLRRRAASRSPKASRRRTSRIVPRYMVQIPKIALDLPKADVLELRGRYTNLYVPSDFFFTHFRWVDAFPPDKPFTMNKPCTFHIMHKDVEPAVENDSVLEPPDADYSFSAKVMLMSMCSLDELYQKCCAMAEDKDKRERESEDKDYVHPARLINFLVGLRGKNETMAIGGPWSPSMDGENPDKDPSVLIRTAIRTCRALTGIDLSSCTQWYRFVELYYRRGESTHKGKTVPARVETVVLYLPDVWSCLPTRLEWDGLHHGYRKQLERRLVVAKTTPAVVTTTAPKATPAEGEPEDDDDGVAAPPPAAAAAAADEKGGGSDEPSPMVVDKTDAATHHSQLDPKSMVVNDLRGELSARGVSSKGLKSQLVARLTKVLKQEAEDRSEDDGDGLGKEEGQEEGAAKPMEVDGGVEDKKVEVAVPEKKLDEKEKALLEKRYALPEQQHIIVHPSKTAKSGKFDCTTMTLSILLDYRPEDTKEHSFEVSLFAELFNEMLMRDFGFNIYRALHELPEKVKDDKDKKKREEGGGDKKAEGGDKKKEDPEGRKSEDHDDKKDQVVKGDDRKDRKKSDNESEDDDDYDDNNEDSKESGGKRNKDSASSSSSKDKKSSKKDRVKMYTKDKHLLLSFIYFDQTHCGYVFDKDMEDLLFALGLNLSRAQVKRLVGKVVTRDSLHYRKLTDKPKESCGDLIVIDDSEREASLHDLAVGNKKLLPVFEREDGGGVRKTGVGSSGNHETPRSEDGLVLFRGALVDVGKLMSQLERSEKARLETESRMVSLKSENTKLLDKYNKANSTTKHLNSDVKEYKEKLRNSEDSLSRVTSYSKVCQSTLTDMRDKIDAVLKSRSIKDEQSSSSSKRDGDKDKESSKKHDESKSRWEKEVKQEEVSESADSKN